MKLEETKNKKSISQYFKDFVPHFKTMKVKDIVIVCLEFILFLLLFILFITFLVDLIQGVHFLGDGLIAYEVVIDIFLFILAGFTLFQTVFDLVFKNYDVPKPTEKTVKNGIVIEVTPEEKKSEDDTKNNTNI